VPCDPQSCSFFNRLTVASLSAKELAGPVATGGLDLKMANQTQRTTQSSTARQSRGRSIGLVSTTQRGASRSPTRTAQRPTTIVVDRTYDHVLKILGFNRSTHPDHPVIQALESASYTMFSELFSHSVDLDTWGRVQYTQYVHTLLQ
jgi:hypothetical protein